MPSPHIETSASAPAARLVLSNITKRYPAVLANDAISLCVQPGEIHAVLGENGAGKSTLMKIIYGVVQPDSGHIQIDGQTVQIHGPHAARALGVSMVFQHFSLFDTLTVAENVWLGLDASHSLQSVTEQITQKVAAYGLDIQPLRPVHTLSMGERQRVEIIRALLTNPKLLILDEPTSVLTPQATEKLFVVLRQLTREGCSILYISHKLHEIRALCDACTVLRDGRVTGSCVPAQESNASLGRMMVGFDPPALVRAAHEHLKPTPPRLALRHFSQAKSEPFGVDLRQISLSVHAGEIVGIAGISGNGQKELLAAIASGVATAAGQHMHIVPEERLGCGAVPSMSLADNLLLTRTEALDKRLGLAWISPKRLQAQATQIMQRFRVKAKDAQTPAQALSGGNLQKFIVGREIDAQPDILVLAQPTWGVDVGAANLIHRELLALRDQPSASVAKNVASDAAQGCAILILSDELEELLSLCDRLYVMAQGRLSPSLDVSQATPSLLGNWMSGLWPSSDTADATAHPPAASAAPSITSQGGAAHA